MADQGQAILVYVSDDALGDIDRIARELEAKGMKIRRVMGRVGMISGSYPSDVWEPLKAVNGVADVEADGVAQHPPSDAKLQ